MESDKERILQDLILRAIRKVLAEQDQDKRQIYVVFADSFDCRCTSFLLGFFAQRKFTLSTLTLYISSPFSLTPSLKVFNAGEKICNLYHETE